jgi:hypothetical protein
MPRASTVRTLLAALIVQGCLAAETEPVRLIEAGHRKRARAIVEARTGDAPAGPLAQARAARAVPDDLTPPYRAALRLPRAERYLRAYLAQPPEGNAPSAADARAQFARTERPR